MVECFNENDYNFAMAMTELPCRCISCDAIFMVLKKTITYERTHKQGKVKFCSKSCMNKFRENICEIKCETCGLLFKRSGARLSLHNFCSHTCSAKFTNSKRGPVSDAQKQKASLSLRNFYLTNKRISKRKFNNPPRIPTVRNRTCKNCFIGFVLPTGKSERRTCSDLCKTELLKKAGKQSASVRQKRSKDEIVLFELCQKHFTNVENNKQIIDGWDADIVINDINLIFWNGPWHYKNIKMKGVSLNQIQKRDEIKLNKFLDAGYKVFIYEDRYFTPEKAFEDLKTSLTVGDN